MRAYSRAKLRCVIVPNYFRCQLLSRSGPPYIYESCERPMSAPNDTLSQLMAGILAGRIRVVDLTVPLEPDTAHHPPAAATSRRSKSFSLEEISRYDSRGPGLVLEQHRVRRAHRHAFRCAHALGHGQGLSEQRHAQHSGGSLHRRGVRHRCGEAGAREPGLPADAGGGGGVGEEARPHSAALPGCSFARTGRKRIGADAFLNIEGRWLTYAGLPSASACPSSRRSATSSV